jgi:hypothetical protein
MSKDRTTPRPWYVGMRPEYDGEYITADRIVGGPTGHDEYDRENGVWALEGDEPCVVAQPDDQANAELIVRAVNNHDELVAALRSLCDWCEATDTDGSVYVSEAITKARAAIAKAEDREAPK